MKQKLGSLKYFLFLTLTLTIITRCGFLDGTGAFGGEQEQSVDKLPIIVSDFQFEGTKAYIKVRLRDPSSLSRNVKVQIVDNQLSLNNQYLLVSQNECIFTSENYTAEQAIELSSTGNSLLNKT